MGKKSFRQFLNEPHGGSIKRGEFSLRAADAYELYGYIWDVLSYRKGSLFRKRMPPQTYSEMAADWAEANPQFAYERNELFHPDVIRRLGFVVDEGGYVHLPR